MTCFMSGWNLQLFEFCVRCCEHWAARMKLKTEWAGRKLSDFVRTTVQRRKSFE